MEKPFDNLCNHIRTNLDAIGEFFDGREPGDEATEEARKFLAQAREKTDKAIEILQKATHQEEPVTAGGPSQSF